MRDIPIGVWERNDESRRKGEEERGGRGVEGGGGDEDGLHLYEVS